MSSPSLTPPKGIPEFLLSRIDYERVNIPKEAEYFKLARMRDLLAAIGNPQDQLAIVHIAGTKGKGSTAAMIASILRESGRKAGLYTSPHIHRAHERMMIDGRMISPKDFERILERLRPVIAEADAKDAASELPIGGPTFFEIINAAALLWFVEQKVDAAVIEVGLGGRLDSTNVCQPKVTVITSIGLDHTKQLGSTLGKIAIEKAGIIKEGVPCVTGVTEAEPLAEIRRIARERGAPLFEIGGHFDFRYQPPPDDAMFRAGQVDYFDRLLGGEYSLRHAELPMLGAHQAANAAVAIAAVRLFTAQGYDGVAIAPEPIDTAAIRVGLSKGKLPARLELVSRAPAILVDAAHNEPSMAALVEAIRDALPKFRKRTVLLAISRDKAIEAMLRLILPHFDRVVCTRFLGNPRACEPEVLGEMAQRIVGEMRLSSPPRIEVFDRPDLAYEAVQMELKHEDFLCVAGSFFIAAEVLELIGS